MRFEQGFACDSFGFGCVGQQKEQRMHQKGLNPPNGTRIAMKGVTLIWVVMGCHSRSLGF